MNFRHAVGFLAIGTLFGLLPRLAPGLFETVGVDGSSGRVVWLQLMSWVQIGLAGGYFLRRVLAAAAMVMEFDPQRAAREGIVVADEGVLVVTRPHALVARRHARAVVVPAALKAGLLEQHQAA